MLPLSQARRDQLVKLYRLGRAPVLCLAALYVIMVLIQATVYAGFGLNTVSFAAQTLKADANDMAAELLRAAGLANMYPSKRPLRYVLLCSPIDSGKGGKPPNPQRLAQAQESVIKQLTEQSGPIANHVAKNLDAGINHMVVLLLPGDANETNTLGFHDQRKQSCLADKDNPARETGRVPASVIFKPREEFHLFKKG
ncbi:MAG: hypothetical protein L0Z50_17400 [Verrucomicrobiales bacterium]|nr:hypothetical protein [Verrucomicrobiales bacterium]